MNVFTRGPMETITNDGLPLEYKLEYGCALRYLDITNIVNDPVLFRVSGVFGYSFEEELPNVFVVGEARSLPDDSADALLVSAD